MVYSSWSYLARVQMALWEGKTGLEKCECTPLYKFENNKNVNTKTEKSTSHAEGVCAPSAHARTHK